MLHDLYYFVRLLDLAIFSWTLHGELFVKIHDILDLLHVEIALSVDKQCSQDELTALFEGSTLVHVWEAILLHVLLFYSNWFSTFLCHQLLVTVFEDLGDDAARHGDVS